MSSSLRMEKRKKISEADFDGKKQTTEGGEKKVESPLPRFVVNLRISIITPCAWDASVDRFPAFNFLEVPLERRTINLLLNHRTPN